MKSPRILHITPWFPNKLNKIEGIFIARHIAALQDHCLNQVLHLSFGKKALYQSNWDGVDVVHATLKPVIDKWRIKEEITFRFLKKYLKEQGQKFNIINFYIAYPNAIKIAYFQKKYPNLKFTISEQWSAYHESFGLSENSKGRGRIANIFHQVNSVISVSTSLGEDIRSFSKNENLQYLVVPNIVDGTDFYWQEKPKTTFKFVSINSWSKMKNPFVLIDAIADLQKEGRDVHLTIAGSGPIDKKIKEHIKRIETPLEITILGRLDRNEVTKLLSESHAYCQSSVYETFSVICIEALASGIPVMATNVGGMRDFIHEKNGILIDNLESDEWKKAMIHLMDNYSVYDKELIINEVLENYNSRTIGKLFYSALTN
ncbi:MAG: glycosyltransferase family 4 protein [Crocinitomicaceae bacterium]|nr:glycosyltransferase family 4 protein [Crocinitomicaceae bacterium]